MASPAGYSGTPLAKKLGIKEGCKIRLINAPDYYFSLFADFPQQVEIVENIAVPKHLVHYFTRSADELAAEIEKLRREIVPNGAIWVSWPKKASKVPTDITEDIIRHLALTNGLVDVKVCAIDATWSGLKLVIPLKDR